MKTLFSTVLMVLRLTPTRAASSAWVQPRSARFALRSFFSMATRVILLQPEKP